MEIENIVANTVYIKARESWFSFFIFFTVVDIFLKIETTFGMLRVQLNFNKSDILFIPIWKTTLFCFNISGILNRIKKKGIWHRFKFKSSKVFFVNLGRFMAKFIVLFHILFSIADFSFVLIGKFLFLVEFHPLFFVQISINRKNFPPISMNYAAKADVCQTAVTGGFSNERL